MRRVIRPLILIVLLLVFLPYVLTPLYSIGHPISTLMIGRSLVGEPVTRTWVDLDKISPALPPAIVGAEDAKFCSHHGIDWGSVRDVIEDAQDGEVVRGGSTITQQLAKNLLLSPNKTVLRKLEEASITLWLELLWDKRRILEVYLNVVEWGSGIFGADAAAQRYFGISATQLNAEQSARLAVMLPAPRRFEKNPNSSYVNGRVEVILARMNSAEVP